MDAPLSYWDRIAPRWDDLLAERTSFMNHQESFRRFHWFLKRSLKIGNRTKSYRLLDLGCGTGEASWPLWKRVASVTFLDHSAAMLRCARNKYAKGVFVRGDAAALPFLDAEFDVIISRGGVLSQLDTEAVPNALAHLSRILRPQGMFCFDLVTNPLLLPAPEGLYRTGWQKPAFEKIIQDHFPGGKITGYDGTAAHAFNRVLLKKA